MPNAQEGEERGLDVASCPFAGAGQGRASSCPLPELLQVLVPCLSSALPHRLAPVLPLIPACALVLALLCPERAVGLPLILYHCSRAQSPLGFSGACVGGSTGLRLAPLAPSREPPLVPPGPSSGTCPRWCLEGRLMVVPTSPCLTCDVRSFRHLGVWAFSSAIRGPALSLAHPLCITRPCRHPPPSSARFMPFSFLAPLYSSMLPLSPHVLFGDSSSGSRSRRKRVLCLSPSESRRLALAPDARRRPVVRRSARALAVGSADSPHGDALVTLHTPGSPEHSMSVFTSVKSFSCVACLRRAMPTFGPSFVFRAPASLSIRHFTGSRT